MPPANFPIIDIHSHFLPREIPDWAKKFGYGSFITLEHTGPGCACMMKGGKQFRKIESNCWDPEVRILERKREGVQIDVLSVIPVMFGYDTKPEHGLEIARFLNDAIADVVVKHPKHFVGLGTLPMQDTELAVKELERCVKTLGFRGIEIGTRVNALDLDDARFLPIFAACEQLDVGVFIHPWEMAQPERLKENWGEWILGMPQETAIAMTRLGFNARILERFPKLRLGFAHGGGVMPWLRGRLKHGRNVRPDLYPDLQPAQFLDKYFYDSHLSDPEALKYLINQVGTKQIMLGSDYPFPLGEAHPGEIIRALALGEDGEAQMLSKTALRFLNLEAESFT